MTKALIVLLLVSVATCQLWVVPQIASALAAAAPEFATLEIPGVLMVGAVLLCVQVVLLCVWRLLTLAARRIIFDAGAFRWVDAIIATVMIAGALVVAGMVVIDRTQAGSPFVLLSGIIALISVAGLALVVVVMRGLLWQATLLRQEMAEVV